MTPFICFPLRGPILSSGLRALQFRNSLTHRTTAFPWGFKCGPTISRAFCTKNGSLEGLNCLCVYSNVYPPALVFGVLQSSCATRSLLGKLGKQSQPPLPARHRIKPPYWRAPIKGRYSGQGFSITSSG